MFKVTLFDPVTRVCRELSVHIATVWPVKDPLLQNFDKSNIAIFCHDKFSLSELTAIRYECHAEEIASEASFQIIFNLFLS
jgi:hypothetical protein